ncbi:carcinine hydrolase/isopenicillin-N N-acyltransferase family protein [Paenibacillus antarcticus]|nr:carcinine hydrolase/isopenicillin-N N-acyltransferase family protein [Paenibacillus antarcticus]
MTSIAYLKPIGGHGCEFWVAIRAILDRCKDVYEGQYLLEEIPLCTNANIMVADTSNQVTIFEVASFSNFIVGIKDLTIISVKQMIHTFLILSR